MAFLQIAVEFLKNLIKTYESINDETDKMIDLC